MNFLCWLKEQTSKYLLIFFLLVGSAANEVGSAANEVGSATNEVGCANNEVGCANNELGNAANEPRCIALNEL